jgi:succinyl-CoA synthetase beta subunit
MATADTVIAMGGSVAGIVDLGGILGLNAEQIGEYMGLIREWHAGTILINFFTQATDLEKLAQSIVVARKIWDPDTKIIIRLKGFRYAEGAAVLDAKGFYHTKLFIEACRKAVG